LCYAEYAKGILLNKQMESTRLRFYSLDVKKRAARIDPPRVDRDPDAVIDYAPAKRWDRDVLQASGEDKLLAVINEIKAGCAELI
jgi:RecJ-like exonuclease